MTLVVNYINHHYDLPHPQRAQETLSLALMQVARDVSLTLALVVSFERESH